MKTSAKYCHLMVSAQGQVKVAKKSSTYDITHKKPAQPKQKIFFRVQTTRLTSSDCLKHQVIAFLYHHNLTKMFYSPPCGKLQITYIVSILHVTIA